MKRYSHQLESGWYLPGSLDARIDRSQADIDEANELLPREEFFALVGIALGQIEVDPQPGSGPESTKPE